MSLPLLVLGVLVLLATGYRLYGLVPGQRSLEDVFVGLVEGGDG